MNLSIMNASFGDLEKILELQRLSFQSEADLLGMPNIPPMIQTLDDLTSEYSNGTSFFKMCLDDVIIGSVRIRENPEADKVYIGRLMIHPSYRRRGYGTMLLKEVESLFPGRCYELFTSLKSAGNIRLYEKLGYHIVAQRNLGDNLVLVDMEKDLRN